MHSQGQWRPDWRRTCASSEVPRPAQAVSRYGAQRVLPTTPAVPRAQCQYRTPRSARIAAHRILPVVASMLHVDPAVELT
eukprot:3069045-Rhodomonas_salina.4